MPPSPRRGSPASHRRRHGGLRPIIEFILELFRVAFDQISPTPPRSAECRAANSRPHRLSRPNGSALQSASQHSHAMEHFYAQIPGLKIRGFPQVRQTPRGCSRPPFATTIRCSSSRAKLSKREGEVRRARFHLGRLALATTLAMGQTTTCDRAPPELPPSRCREFRSRRRAPDCRREMAVLSSPLASADLREPRS